MKRIVIILSLLMVICITSCSEEFLPSNSTYDSSDINIKITQADDITTKSEISVAVRPEEVGLPAYECKFDKDVWEISKTSQVTLSYNEEIIPTGTHVIRRLANEVPAAPGNFPPSLKLDNSHNGDYEVTFSYFVPKSGFLDFVMFDETNITSVNDYLGDQYFGTGHQKCRENGHANTKVAATKVHNIWPRKRISKIDDINTVATITYLY